MLLGRQAIVEGRRYQMRPSLLRSGPGQAPEARNGSPDSLDELYLQHGPDIKRWARRLAGPQADLEDLLHDVFLIALRRTFVARGQGSVRTWLFRITEHVVRTRRRRGFIRGLLFRRHQDAMVAAAATPATPHEEAERRERHQLLYRALDRLADSYRTTLILYEIEGLSADEVAELTGVPVGTVCVRLHRGRAKLVASLAREGQR
jgi:RNA polymerase sigma-70 factor, ECF subfamily